MIGGRYEGGIDALGHGEGIGAKGMRYRGAGMRYL